MGEGYRLGAGRASSSVQPSFEAFVVSRRPRQSAGLSDAPDETSGTRSDSAATGQIRKETPVFAGTPHLQVANGVAPTLLFLVLVLTALGVIAHAAFI